jgi:hypothetical protein
MKAVIRLKEKDPDSEYPIIKKRIDVYTIVLFIAPSEGIALDSNYYKPGHYSRVWNEASFTPVHGTIEITV